MNNSIKEIITSTNAAAPIGPYSHAVLVNGMLFVSGQVAKKADSGEMVLSDIDSETHQVMHNLRAILEEADMNFDNVVKTTIFLKDMNDFGTVNEVYGNYFKADFPARETVQVARLPKDVNVEISVIAVKL